MDSGGNPNSSLDPGLGPGTFRRASSSPLSSAPSSPCYNEETARVQEEGGVEETALERTGMSEGVKTGADEGETEKDTGRGRREEEGEVLPTPPKTLSEGASGEGESELDGLGVKTGEIEGGGEGVDLAEGRTSGLVDRAENVGVEEVVLPATTSGQRNVEPAPVDRVTVVDAGNGLGDLNEAIDPPTVLEVDDTAGNVRPALGITSASTGSEPSKPLDDQVLPVDHSSTHGVEVQDTDIHVIHNDPPVAGCSSNPNGDVAAVTEPHDERTSEPPSPSRKRRRLNTPLLRSSSSRPPSPGALDSTPPPTPPSPTVAVTLKAVATPTPSSSTLSSPSPPPSSPTSRTTPSLPADAPIPPAEPPTPLAAGPPALIPRCVSTPALPNPTPASATPPLPGSPSNRKRHRRIIPLPRPVLPPELGPYPERSRVPPGDGGQRSEMIFRVLLVDRPPEHGRGKGKEKKRKVDEEVGAEAAKGIVAGGEVQGKRRRGPPRGAVPNGLGAKRKTKPKPQPRVQEAAPHRGRGPGPRRWAPARPARRRKFKPGEDSGCEGDVSGNESSEDEARDRIWAKGRGGKKHRRTSQYAIENGVESLSEESDSSSESEGSEWDGRG